MHKGVCVGGPMAGQTITTRSEAGFVAVDADGFAAWLYRITGNGSYQLDLSPDAALLDSQGTRSMTGDQAAALAAQRELDLVALAGEDDEAPADPPPIDDSYDQGGGF